MARRKIIAGNWKMYKTIEEAVAFVNALKSSLADSEVDVWLAVPFTAIAPAIEAAKGSNILIGAQNMHDATEGAFTGEVAATMLLDAGAQFVILGHSERRQIFGEDNAFIHKKLVRALKDGLRPILCVGETEKERDEGKAEEVIKEQITTAFEGISAKAAAKVVIAYEPVWAIGTGNNATPAEAETMHQAARHALQELYNANWVESTPIIYGGSVKTTNAKALLDKEEIDGVLVGGASLSLDSFQEIIHYKSI